MRYESSFVKRYAYGGFQLDPCFEARNVEITEQF